MIQYLKGDATNPINPSDIRSLGKIPVQIKVIKNFKEKVETIFINKRENGVVTFTYLVSPFAKEFIMTEEKLASITIK